jgi:hypothetical protein
MSGVIIPKPRPARDVRYVLHPEQDAGYVHFEGATAVPFDAAAGRMHRNNAWWLADAALLTYWGAAAAVARFAAAGFDAQLLDVSGVQCYVATGGNAAIVAFRGTQPDQWSDIFDDAFAVLVPWDRKGSGVHAGFKLALDRVWPKLGPILTELAKTRRLWFTGHSLGAALATLAADRCPDSAGVLTVGSPRVGDPHFSDQFNARFAARAFRFVNNTDVVTHVPPPLPLPYKHVGELHHIDRSGHVGPEPGQFAHFVPDLIGDTMHLAETMQGLRSGALKTAPTFLLDHMPRGYAVDIWNDFAANGD